VASAFRVAAEPTSGSPARTTAVEIASREIFLDLMCISLRAK
jgi:hypothetical protein